MRPEEVLAFSAARCYTIPMSNPQPLSGHECWKLYSMRLAAAEPLMFFAVGNLEAIRMIMEQIIGAVIGFVLEFITNGVFWKYMLFLRPDISLSPQVAKKVDQENGQTLYRFKIRNNGKRQAVNISLCYAVCCYAVKA